MKGKKEKSKYEIMMDFEAYYEKKLKEVEQSMEDFIIVPSDEDSIDNI